MRRAWCTTPSLRTIEKETTANGVMKFYLVRLRYDRVQEFGISEGAFYLSSLRHMDGLPFKYSFLVFRNQAL